MVSAILIEYKPDTDELEGLGEHQLTTLPRVGDHVDVNSDNGWAELLRVTAVVHAGDGAGADVYVQRLGQTIKHIKSVASGKM